MSSTRSLIALAATLICSGCQERNLADPPEEKLVSDLAARIVTHAKYSRGKIILDADEPIRIWSDGAFLELGVTFPDPIEEMLATPTHTYDISPFLTDLESRMDSGWRDARFATDPNESGLVDVLSMTSKASVQIEPLYRDYILVRFPNATIRIKDSSSPILVLMDGAIRASVMPKQLENKSRQDNPPPKSESEIDP